MKKVVGFAMAVLLVGIVAVGMTKGSAEGSVSVRDGVFLHVSHGTDDPHRLLMALNMANLMSDDHDVLVYFDIKAVDAVLKDSSDITFSHFTSSKTQLAALREKGVVLMACPGCLKAVDKSSTDLADGIQVADRNQFFSFTQGRILSLDY